MMKSKSSCRSLRRRTTLAALCLTALSGCGTVTIAPVAEPPAVLMLPPTRLASLTLKPSGKRIQLSDIERQHRIEAATCGATEEQLLALQRWAGELNADR